MARNRKITPENVKNGENVFLTQFSQGPPDFQLEAKLRPFFQFFLQLTLTEAKQIGICVDTRRRNKSAENLSRNVQRLKEYKQKIVILKKGQACDIAQNTERKVMALAQPVINVESQAITEDMKKGSVYQAFHMARANVKFAGQREKRRLARLAAEEEKKSRKK